MSNPPPDRTDPLASLEAQHGEAEEPGFLSRQLITCLGNKRALLGPIAAAMEEICARLGGRAQLTVLDAFAGSGVVSRYLKRYSSHLVSNDLEQYAEAIGKCFLSNRSDVHLQELAESIEELNRSVLVQSDAPGFFERLYAPIDDDAIRDGDRVFYTRENAQRLDRYRSMIDGLPVRDRALLLGPLLAEASVHANTAGVFKGFYKDRSTGLGAFGGTGRDAISRIRGPITLRPPVLSRFECDVEVRRSDVNVLATEATHFDVAYLDPPYNQHPYGSNYFMLNLLTTYEEPAALSPVSGIPANWNRSKYNVRSQSFGALARLIDDLDATFILLAYNDEGFITPDEVRDLLIAHGRLSEAQTKYNAFRGSRNLAGRARHVTEHLFILEKSDRRSGGRSSRELVACNRAMPPTE
ncbi:MAG TPA: DNA adenine methylase [Acidimicrobiales bacterium]|jgi:adenine-specific DNA-methyltransferase|nr:DNA adenine methylase [Acidimicrobiales bacterium]